MSVDLMVFTIICLISLSTRMLSPKKDSFQQYNTAFQRLEFWNIGTALLIYYIYVVGLQGAGWNNPEGEPIISQRRNSTNEQ